MSHDRITVRWKRRKIEIATGVWNALLLLGPDWIAMEWNTLRCQTRGALVRRGWAEIKYVGYRQPGCGYVLARITRAGRRIRDEVLAILARRESHALWQYNGKRREQRSTRYDRKDPVPTSFVRSSVRCSSGRAPGGQ